MDTGPRKELLRFLKEDIGKGDITSNLLPKKKVKARIISRQKGKIAGVNYVKEIFLMNKCSVRNLKKDGNTITAKQTVLKITGQASKILSCERTALNLLSRMSGIATSTSLLVEKINRINPKVKLFATRKTAPGLRFFDKEAVRIGGGKKHRMSLDEMVLIKDNHIATVSNLPSLIYEAKKRKHKIIEVEVEDAKNALLAAKLGATIIMLDNFSPKKIRNTVKILESGGLRDKVKLEASGGINEKNIGSYAKTGIDYISVGYVTNSVPAIDFSLEID